MLKRLLLAFVLVAFTAAVALAAQTAGTVAAIDGRKVQITLKAEKAEWMKVGTSVKIKGGNGKIVEVGEATVTVSTPKASGMKVGDEVSFEKGRVSSGC